MILRSAALFLALLVLPATAAAGLSESYGRLPLHFEENRGQADQEVRFLARGPGYGLYLTASEAVLVLGGKERTVLRMALIGASPNPSVKGLEELPGKANYFIGKDSSKWRTNVATYGKVRYREVYPGIDLVYYGNQRQLEYDFVIAPGADPEEILLRFEGTDAIKVDAQGDLVLRTAAGDLRQRKPVVYQEIDGTRREIDGRYVVRDANRVSFQVAAHDRRQPLVIDPVLAYSTYLGGIGVDFGRGIAVDVDGNAYVTGLTNSINFPTTLLAFQLLPGSPVPPPNSSDAYDAFVTKLNPQGTALVYSTYLGGDAHDSGVGIAVGSNGNAYVTGFTRSITFPTTLGAFQTTHPDTGFFVAFVTQLNATGAALVYSTYLGGSTTAGRWHDDAGSGIAVDAAGNSYVTGYTNAIDFPVTAGVLQPALSPGTYHNAFVTKLNPSGSSLVYSTYLGGTVFDYGSGIAVDIGGNAYVVGSTQSPTFPTTVGAFQTTFLAGKGRPGYSNLFVSKLDPAGPALVYSTYLGGTGSESGTGIAVDSGGNAYLTGLTVSTDFPTTLGAFQPTIKAYNSAFVTKLDASGSSLVYSTYLGGSGKCDPGIGEMGSGIAVDASGNAYVAGTTCSVDFPTTAAAFQPVYGGGDADAFLTKLNPTGSALVHSSYLGGDGWDFGRGIAVATEGTAYVVGATNSINFPTTPGAFQPIYNGDLYDAFVAKIID